MRDHNMAIVAALVGAAEAAIAIRADIRPTGPDAEILRVYHAGRYCHQSRNCGKR